MLSLCVQISIIYIFGISHVYLSSLELELMSMECDTCTREYESTVLQPRLSNTLLSNFLTFFSVDIFCCPSIMSNDLYCQALGRGVWDSG